jgi:hypothetical protein
MSWGGICIISIKPDFFNKKAQWEVISAPLQLTPKVYLSIILDLIAADQRIGASSPSISSFSAIANPGIKPQQPPSVAAVRISS